MFWIYFILEIYFFGKLWLRWQKKKKKDIFIPFCFKSSSLGDNVKNQKYLGRKWEATEILNRNIWRQKGGVANNLLEKRNCVLGERVAGGIGGSVLQNPEKPQELEVQVPWKVGVKGELKTESLFEKSIEESMQSPASLSFQAAVRQPALLTPHWTRGDSFCLRILPRGG